MEVEVDTLLRLVAKEQRVTSMKMDYWIQGPVM